jgi:hypothetical protein
MSGGGAPAPRSAALGARGDANRNEAISDDRHRAPSRCTPKPVAGVHRPGYLVNEKLFREGERRSPIAADEVAAPFGAGTGAVKI